MVSSTTKLCVVWPKGMATCLSPSLPLPANFGSSPAKSTFAGPEARSSRVLLRAYWLWFPQSIWIRSGAPPPAIWVASFWLYGPNWAYWVLTSIFGLAFSNSRDGGLGGLGP